MDERLRMESERLARSWDQYDPEKLRSYLVSSVEDPRTNLQSILTRHFLLSLLFPGRFDALRNHELTFAAFVTWLGPALQRNVHPDDWFSILHALERCADNAEGYELPPFLARTFAQLPATIDGAHVPNYIRAILSALREIEHTDKSTSGGGARPMDQLRETFAPIWNERLLDSAPARLRVVEVACGSANDYRFIERYGVSRFLDYTGFDISEKNVANARAICPSGTFQVGNVFALPLPNDFAEACFFHDLLEHLSLEGLERAVSEVCRVTKRSICAGLFSAWEGHEHIVRPVDEYYCNTLSLSRLEELFRRNGFAIRQVHVGSYMNKQFSPLEYHNPHAYTLYCDRVANQ